MTDDEGQSEQTRNVRCTIRLRKLRMAKLTFGCWTRMFEVARWEWE
ncbi:hypothetical protein LCGC14_0378030 [marine sediment metagenome]|uniref:Uncharacterized protein n=1 Tax=marine sediment metagenome TaxID=412755 RepID=A0A0F9T315_9ZZZZ